MGRRGPAPRPSAIDDVLGNPGHRKKNKREPKPKSARPGMPSWLSKDAKTEWKRIVPELAKVGLLTLVDRTALASYCQAHAELQIATRLLDKEGRIVEEDVYGKDGEVKGTVTKAHPAVKLQRDAFTRVKQFINEFGLTPASRSRLQVTPEEKTDAADPTLRYFDGDALG
jgi:P27 family predicted phage terminase small subunit